MNESKEDENYCVKINVRTQFAIKIYIFKENMCLLHCKSYYLQDQESITLEQNWNRIYILYKFKQEKIQIYIYICT